MNENNLKPFPGSTETYLKLMQILALYSGEALRPESYSASERHEVRLKSIRKESGQHFIRRYLK